MFTKISRLRRTSHMSITYEMHHIWDVSSFHIQSFQATYCMLVQGSSACQVIFVLLLLSMVFTFHISSTISNLINWLLDIKWNLSVSLKLKSGAIWVSCFSFPSARRSTDLDAVIIANAYLTNTHIHHSIC